MTPDTDELPETWFEIEVSYPSFQEQMWRRGEDGKVLVVESEDGPDMDEPEWYTRLLSVEFEQDPEPLQEIVGGVPKEDAIKAAWGFM